MLSNALVSMINEHHGNFRKYASSAFEVPVLSYQENFRKRTTVDK